MEFDKTIYQLAEGIEERLLLCPQCGFEFVHPIAVEIATGEYSLRCDVTGIQIHHGESILMVSAKKRRGVVILLEYICENKHHGDFQFYFRKGQIFVQHTVRESFEDLEVIWRDDEGA